MLTYAGTCSNSTSNISINYLKSKTLLILSGYCDFLASASFVIGLLSSSLQDHYDFGMRAVKSVLVMAGALKRGNPNLNEDIVLIRALRDSNLPKFLKQDAELFRVSFGPCNGIQDSLGF